MADPNALANMNQGQNSWLSNYELLPTEIRLRFIRHVLHNPLVLQIMPMYLVDHGISMIGPTRLVARFANDIPRLASVRSDSGMTALVEDVGISTNKLQEMQQSLSGVYDASRNDVSNPDVRSMKGVSGSSYGDTTAQLTIQGFHLQVYGYGVPNLQRMPNLPPGSHHFVNVKWVTLSPTIFHKLDYTPFLRSLPNLKLIYIDPVVIDFIKPESRFDAKAFMAGIHLNEPVVQRSLRTAADSFMPRNFGAPGVQDALIVRQIFWLNWAGDMPGEILCTLFAKRTSTSVPGGDLPWLIECYTILKTDDIEAEVIDIHRMDSVFADINIEDTTRLGLDFSHVSLARILALEQDYRKVERSMAALRDGKSFLDSDDEDFRFCVRYIVRGTSSYSVSLV